MSKTIDIEDAQDHLLELVNLASQGEEIIISRDEKPLARIIAISGASASSAEMRTPGLSRGVVKWISPDFDESLPDDFWLGGRPLFDNHA